MDDLEGPRWQQEHVFGADSDGISDSDSGDADSSDSDSSNDWNGTTEAVTAVGNGRQTSTTTAPPVTAAAAPAPAPAQDDMRIPAGGLDISTRHELLATLGPGEGCWVRGAGSGATPDAATALGHSTTFSFEYARSDTQDKSRKTANSGLLFQYHATAVQPECSALSHEELRLNDYSLYRRFVNKLVLDKQAARTRMSEAAANIKAKAAGMPGVFILTGATYALPTGADVGAACNGIFRQSGEHNGKPLFKRVDGGDAAVYFQGFWKVTSPATSLGGWWFGNKDSTGDLPPSGTWRHDGNPWPAEQSGVSRTCPTMDWQ